MHRIDLFIDSVGAFQIGPGTELSNGNYLFSAYPMNGFCYYDKDLNFIDSVRSPFRARVMLQQQLISNACGGAFCAFNSYDSVGSYPHIFAVNFDSLFNNYRDLKISMHSNCLVPADSSNKIFVSFLNKGNKMIDTTATVILDTNTYYLSSSPSPVSISGDTLTYRINSLNPADSQNIVLNIKVDSTLGLGALLTFYSQSPYSNNLGSSDDTVTYCGTTVSSIDPNFKIVDRPFYFTPDKDIVYTVGFENTGNYYARNVTIIDTLDTDLDTLTLKTLGGSPMKPSLELLAGNIVKFVFADIYLSDSITNPEGNRGQVVYSIRTSTNASIGDTIRNTAHIHFDYNPDVVTNTTLNIVSNFDGPYVERQDISVGPNPSAGYLTVLLPQISGEWNISIFDLSGRVMTSDNFRAGNINLNLNLANGLYLMKMTNLTSKTIFVRKLVFAR